MCSEFNTNGSVGTLSIHHDEAAAEGRCTWSVTDERAGIFYNIIMIIVIIILLLCSNLRLFGKHRFLILILENTVDKKYLHIRT